MHLSEVDADKWPPLLKQVALAKEGCIRPVQPSIADGYEAVSKLIQKQKRLTDDEITQMVSSYRAGSTIRELTALFGCDRKTVMRYLKLNCVETRYRKLSPAQIDEVVRLYEHGASLTQIGKRFSVDPKTVKARLLEREEAQINLRKLSTPQIHVSATTSE